MRLLLSLLFSVAGFSAEWRAVSPNHQPGSDPLLAEVIAVSRAARPALGLRAAGVFTAPDPLASYSLAPSGDVIYHPQMGGSGHRIWKCGDISKAPCRLAPHPQSTGALIIGEGIAFHNDAKLDVLLPPQSGDHVVLVRTSAVGKGTILAALASGRIASIYGNEMPQFISPALDHAAVLDLAPRGDLPGQFFAIFGGESNTVWRRDRSRWVSIGVPAAAGVVYGLNWDGEQLRLITHNGVFVSNDNGDSFSPDGLSGIPLAAYGESADANGGVQWAVARSGELFARSSVTSCLFEQRELNGKKDTLMTIGHLGGDAVRILVLVGSGKKEVCRAYPGFTADKWYFKVQLLRFDGSPLRQYSANTHIRWRFHPRPFPFLKVEARGVWLDSERRQTGVGYVQGAITSGYSCSWTPLLTTPEPTVAGAHIRLQFPLQVSSPDCPNPNVPADLLGCLNPALNPTYIMTAKMATCSAILEAGGLEQ